DALRVIGRAQRGGNQRLSFAAGEDRGTVNPRQHANFNRDGTNLVELTRIRTATLVGYLVAEDALAKSLIIMRELLRGFFVVFGQLGLQSILDLFNFVVAFELGILRRIQRVGELGAHFVLEGVVVSLVKLDGLDLQFRLAAALRQLANGGTDLLDLLV